MVAAANYIAPYRPLAWQVTPWRDTSPVILLTGGAGGGKSRLAGEKIHALMMRYPGAMGLMVRKTRESMTNSTVLFMQHSVIGGDKRVKLKEQKHRFEYQNGSILAYGGMANEEQREQLRSIGQKGSLDFVWIEEGNKLSRRDFNELIARMRGTSAPFCQIIITTNPDAPTHWINQDLILKRGASVYYSSAVDNSYNPTHYVTNLSKLNGVEYDRLVRGLWVQAEGVVYDNFSLEENVTEDAEYKPGIPVWWGYDDGYVFGGGPGSISYHPRVILFSQVNNLGGIDIFDEYYSTGEASYETTINNALGKGYPQPDVSYGDSSAAMLRGNLMERGILAGGATHEVIEGIRNVRRMLCDENDVRLIRIHPRCKQLIQEMQSYSYDDRAQSRGGDRKPLKIDDHGPDVLRYLSWQLRRQ